MKSLAVLALSLTTAVAAFAQNAVVTGRVVDEQNEPMIAAGVVQQGTTNGTITLELPQNSIGDWFMRRWAAYCRVLQNPNRVALDTLTLWDPTANVTTIATGISLQKAPDRVFDRTATNVVYTLLAATISEQ